MDPQGSRAVWGPQEGSDQQNHRYRPSYLEQVEMEFYQPENQVRPRVLNSMLMFILFLNFYFNRLLIQAIHIIGYSITNMKEKYKSKKLT